MLTPRGTDLWTIDHPHSAGGLALGTRTTVVRLPAGLWIHSTGPWTAALRAELPGPVVALVAPNTMHHLYLSQAQAIFPDARTWLCPELARKCPELRYDELLSEQPAWPGVLEQHRVEGLQRLEEYVFFHPASRSLILVDLCFNLRATRSWFTRLFMTLNGALGRFGPTRLFKSLMIGDRIALRRSVDTLLRWDFERVILGHGEVLEHDARETLRRAFSFLSG